MSKPLQVVILGGGIAGLSSAYFLRDDKNIRVTVLEKEPELGGLARTVRMGDFLFDLGVHGLFPSSAESEPYYRRAAEIMGEERIEIKKSTAIWFRERLVNYPLGIRELFFTLTIRELVACTLDFCRARILLYLGKARPGKSFHDWITFRFGTRLYNIYFGPYAEKTWGISGDRIDGEHIFRRVTTVSLMDVIKRAFLNILSWRGRFSDFKYSQQPPTCYYGRTGVQVLINNLRRELTPHQVRFMTGVMIKNIVVKAGRIESVVYERDGKREELCADYVVSTIPLTELARYILGEDHSSRLLYRAMVLVHIALEYNPFPQQWIYFPSRQHLFNRLNNYTNLFPSASPPGQGSINFEITCFKDDDIWKMPDDEITRRVLTEAGQNGFLDPSRVLKTGVTRLSHAYPIFQTDTEEYLGKLMKRLSRPNLFFAGRQANFCYINMDEAVKKGEAAAQAIKKEVE